MPFILPVTIDGTSIVNAEAPDAFLDAQWTSLPGGAVPAEFSGRLIRLVREYHKRKRGVL